MILLPFLANIVYGNQASISGYQIHTVISFFFTIVITMRGKTIACQFMYGLTKKKCYQVKYIKAPPTTDKQFTHVQTCTKLFVSYQGLFI